MLLKLLKSKQNVVESYQTVKSLASILKTLITTNVTFRLVGPGTRGR